MTARDNLPSRAWTPDEWPEVYREQWSRARASGGFLDDPGKAADWKEASLTKTTKGFGYFLAWADLHGAPVGAPLSTLVTRERVTAFVRELEPVRAGNTVSCRVQELYDAVRVMEPDQDWGWLRRLCAVVKSRAQPVRDKNGRLRPADALEALGHHLMEEAEDIASWSDLRRAVQFRDGLKFVLLVRRPIRISNFAALRLGHEIVEVDGTWRLDIPASDTKGNQPIDTHLPDAVVEGLDRYVHHHRLVLLGRGDNPNEPALWIAETGKGMAEISVHNCFRRHTRRAFGDAIPPHWFRDAATTAVVLDAPAEAMITMKLLGHATPDIAERHYNRAQAIDSSRRYVALVGALMEDHGDHEE